MADAFNDLSIVPQTSSDKNYFNVTIKNLKLNKTYATQFKWIYSDDQTSDWSPSYVITTSNESAPAVPTSVAVPGTSTGSIPVTLSAFPTNAKRVDVVVSNGIFGTSKVAHSFTTSGVATIAAPAGTYVVQLRSISPTGVTSTVGTTFTIVVSDAGETVQSPTNPSGFTSKRILAGIEVSWAGTYASSTFTGFEAINIYAGNSATATAGTYEQVGVLTGNNVKNTIVIPLGTYVVYGQPVYIHAAAVNRSGTVGTIQANVTNQALGPGKAGITDILAGTISVNNLEAGDIGATSFIRAGTSSSARVELSSSTVGSVLPGFYIYNSTGTPVLSAPLSGGLSITGAVTATSGSFTGAVTATSGSFTGTVTAATGSIGNWQINDNALKNSAVAYPNIMLDPSGAKIELRTTAGNGPSEPVSNYIKMDTTAGLRIGTGASPKFTVDMSGNMVASDATLYGKIITTGTNPQSYTGTLTIDSGYITQTAQLYLNTPFLYANTNSVYLQSADGYFLLDTTGGLIVGQGNATGDLQMRITTVDNPPYPRGFQLFGLDNTEFRAPSQHVSNSYNSPTVVVGAGGSLMSGRTLWYGSSGTSSTINAAVGGSLGDIYFSTS